MSTTRLIAHNTIYQIVGKIISTFLGLIALGMMTRYLGAEQFGWYITTMAFLQFIGILIDFGLIPVTSQMLSEPEFDKDRLFKNLLGFRLTSAFIFFAFAPIVALFFPYPTEVKIAISFTTISFLAVALNQVFLGFYQTKLKMHLTAIGENLGRLVLVVGLWFVIREDKGFIPVMIVVILNSLAYTAFLWLSAKKYTKISLAFDWQIWKVIIIKMWPIAVSIIFNVVYLKGDVILLSLFSNQIEVGIYGAAYRVIDILSQTAMMIMGVMLPLLAYNWSRNIKEQFKKFYQMSFDMMMLLAVPMLVGSIALAPKIMVLVAGQNFIDSGFVLQILSLAVFGVYLGAVFGHTAVAINKQKQTMWIYISNAIITLIGYLIFIPKFGMYGAAWMTVFSELYAGILLFFIIRHYIKENLRLKPLVKIIISSLIMGGALVIFNKLPAIYLVILGIFIYAVMTMALQTVSIKTISEIVSLKKDE